jgi:hypothetical protein
MENPTKMDEIHEKSFGSVDEIHGKSHGSVVLFH